MTLLFCYSAENIVDHSMFAIIRPNNIEHDGLFVVPPMRICFQQSLNQEKYHNFSSCFRMDKKNTSDLILPRVFFHINKDLIKIS